VGARHTGRSVRSLLSLPIGQAIIAWAVLRSAIIGVRNGGIEWRGTHYPLAELRANRRVDV
jgi:hypothetical protein